MVGVVVEAGDESEFRGCQGSEASMVAGDQGKKSTGGGWLCVDGSEAAERC